MTHAGRSVSPAEQRQRIEFVNVENRSEKLGRQFAA
jgi:hypothetical protein